MHQKFKNELANVWQKWNYLLVFLITTTIFLLLQLPYSLTDGDAFYHAKIADLMIQKKNLVLSFPWLPFTTLSDAYADHHLLFHTYLIPFILVIKDPLLGTKIATVFLAGVFCTAFYWFLKRHKVNYPVFFLLLLLLSYSLVFRLSADKAIALSLLLLTLGIHFILEKKKLALMLLSFLYVWSYGGWPLIFVTTLFYVISHFVLKLYKESTEQQTLKIYQKIKTALVYAFQKENIWLLLASLTGIILGIILHPYFPHNIKFFWVQIFQIGVLTLASKYGMGGEWYPPDAFSLIFHNSLTIVLWLALMAWFFMLLKKETTLAIKNEQEENLIRDIFFLTILSLFFFIYTLKSQRAVEYFIPLAILATSFLSKFYLPKINLSTYLMAIKNFFSSNDSTLLAPKIFSFLIIFYFLFLFFLVNYQLTFEIVNFFKNDAQGFHYLENVSKFAKMIVPPKSIIFHNRWDYFPELFYYNDQNYYIVGLDITFMYYKDKELFKLWHKITSGNEKDNLSETIKNKFLASHVIAIKPRHLKDKNTQRFIKYLLQDEHFKKLYEDEEAYLFKIE